MCKNYLRRRRISKRTAIKCSLLNDKKEKRIVVPIYGMDQKLYGFSGRTYVDGIKPKVRDYKGFHKKYHILGQHAWKDDQPLLLVEGMFDYLRMIEENVDTLVNVGGLFGATINKEKCDIIERFGAPTYFLTDNDKAGENAIFGVYDNNGVKIKEGALDILRGKVLRFVPEYPKGKKEPDQLNFAEVKKMIEETNIWLD